MALKLIGKAVKYGHLPCSHFE